MEPLAIAVLSALTPADIERDFVDDRLERIDYEEPVDLVALSVETYTARRAYQIALEYRKRGVPVVMGGFHPTLVPDDALEYADAIVVGEAEQSWPQLLKDFSRGELKRIYRMGDRREMKWVNPDRTVYADKNYLPIALIETARGCCFECEFCSITKFYERSYRRKPVSDVVADIQQAGRRYVFFTDDNIAVDKKRLKDLLSRLVPLKIFWVAQASIDIAEDSELLKLMRRSGCICLLIGFESLRPAVLTRMKKGAADRSGSYVSAVRTLRKHGIGIYGTFVFGYDDDRDESFRQTLEFAKRNGFFFAAFNHLVPFPGTELYERLELEERLLYSRWWRSADYRFGDVAFRVEGMSEQELAEKCYMYRRRFYSAASIIRRLKNWRVNCSSLQRLYLFLRLNLLSYSEIEKRQSLPLGFPEEDV
jgi:radical SAM superfamily enzyme YgiQ (UPF0313 family)